MGSLSSLNIATVERNCRKCTTLEVFFLIFDRELGRGFKTKCCLKVEVIVEKCNFKKFTLR